MKKILLSFLFLFLGLFIKAQLDTEHWFAAMYDGQTNGNTFQYLHLSTDNIEPFEVTVFSGNQPIATSTIRKGSPQYIFIPRQYIIVENFDSSNLFQPIKKGLNVVGQQRFYANLRFGMTNHAEIITSKGNAGLGTEFYTVMAPNQQEFNLTQGFSASIIATSDNTTVTIPKFNKTLQFSDVQERSSLTFTLNKGESYIIDGRSTSINNLDGFIGTKIISDKPISITNGNFNGQYISNTVSDSGSDILMDQSVPTDKLGNEFGIIKGYGDITADGNGMERVIIVATKEKTDVYINSSNSPVITLNEGEYFFIPDTYYVNQGNNHYNIHIKTTENVYVYQMLSGVESARSPLATGGMNYIPPLNCYLPRKIDEIGHIDRIGNQFRTAKLNIISEKGAKVLINGNSIDSNFGPFPLQNALWETYSVPNISGNITITSNKAVTAGLAGGDGGAEGYGGYFAGFSSIPIISKKSGECLPDIILELPEGFQKYIWEKRNLDGTYSIVSEGSHLFNPKEIGHYRAKIQQGSCDEVTTQDFKLLNCVTYTSNELEICNEEEIITQLSLSNQIIDGESIRILEQPKIGSLTIDKVNKTITYIANKNASGSDYFRYSICGVNNNPECEEVKTSITVRTIPYEQTIGYGCLQSNGQIVYDLKRINLTPNSNEYLHQFFETKIDAENNQNEIINNVTSYITSQNKIFVKLSSKNGCEDIIETLLEQYPLPEIKTYEFEICDDQFKDNIEIDLKILDAHFIKNHSYFPNIKYYVNEQDAISKSNNYIKNTFNITGKTNLFIAVESPIHCETLIFPITLSISEKVSINTLFQSIEICDNDLDGFKEENDLQKYRYLFTDDNSVSLSFFETKENAITNRNPINKLSFSTTEKNLFVRFSQDGLCPNLSELSIKIKIPKNSTKLKDQTICLNSNIILDAASEFTYYKWSTGEEGNNKSSIIVSQGNYWVDLTYDGCIYRQYVNVDYYEQPEITSIEVKGNEATLNVDKGTTPYQYSIDGVHWQQSPTFRNLTRGIHTAYVKGADSCSILNKEFLIINLINVLTPNGDGYNDVLDYSDLRIKENVSIEIFDRYGNKIHQSEGKNYIWDGKNNGRSVSSDSYWYILKWIEPDTQLSVVYSNWILVKNRE